MLKNKIIPIIKGLLLIFIPESVGDIYSDPMINKKTVRDTLISENCFTLDKYLEIDLNVMKALYDKKREFKIAILDKNGSIMQVSDSFEVHNDDKAAAAGYGYVVIVLEDKLYCFEPSKKKYRIKKLNK